ncbi:hypothetical protein AVEN_125281-1 [Araneus ventricosus]|uniref:Uncharacterized protein n=1 Tax=Araneus ventricosus TaxID=182803 RepID=A0A4Y2JHH9_ARAVE|nr:hypothetical protein AVEN_125281-1 [Araneus ventricosus]
MTIPALHWDSSQPSDWAKLKTKSSVPIFGVTWRDTKLSNRSTGGIDRSAISGETAKSEKQMRWPEFFSSEEWKISGGLVVRETAFCFYERGFDPRLGGVRSFVTILHRNRPKELPPPEHLRSRTWENASQFMVGLSARADFDFFITISQQPFRVQRSMENVICHRVNDIVFSLSPDENNDV